MKKKRSKNEDRTSTKIQWKPNKKERKQYYVACVILVILLVICTQYIITKHQVSQYSLNDYACVHMSYDMEKYFEQQWGIRTVQRRVENEHRWIALEILPNIYLEYETTLRMFGVHFVTDDMVGEKIYQSEGFWDGSTELMHVNNHEDMHIKLKDWIEIGTESGPANEGFWKSIL